MSLTAVEAKKLLMAAERGELEDTSRADALEAENEELRDQLRKKESNLRRLRKELRELKS